MPPNKDTPISARALEQRGFHVNEETVVLITLILSSCAPAVRDTLNSSDAFLLDQADASIGPWGDFSIDGTQFMLDFDTLEFPVDNQGNGTQLLSMQTDDGRSFALATGNLVTGDTEYPSLFLVGENESYYLEPVSVSATEAVFKAGYRDAKTGQAYLADFTFGIKYSGGVPQFSAPGLTERFHISKEGADLQMADLVFGNPQPTALPKAMTATPDSSVIHTPTPSALPPTRVFLPTEASTATPEAPKFAFTTQEFLQNFDYNTGFTEASWDDVVRLHQEIQANPMLSVESPPMDLYDSWKQDGNTLVLIKGQLGINLQPRYAVEVPTPNGDLHMIIVETISTNNAGEVVHGSINVLIEKGYRNYGGDSIAQGKKVKKLGHEIGYYIAIRFILETNDPNFFTDLIRNAGINTSDHQDQGRVDFINGEITPNAGSTGFFAAEFTALGK